MIAGRVLITGAGGFIGRRLTEQLCRGGAQVRALVRPTSAAAADLARLGAEVATGDVLDRDSLAAAVQGVDVVFHLAGRLLVAGVPDEEYARLHVDGTRNLLAACVGAGRVRAVVHCSTTGVLGITGERPAAEDAPASPGTVYERTKAAGERAALEYAAALPVVVARPALVYGPGDLHLLGWFRAIKRGLYRVIGGGASLLHPIYIDDLVDGLVRCAGAASGRIYNLVGHRPAAVRELAAAIAAALGVRLPRLGIPLPLAYAAAAALEALPGVPPASLPLTRSRVAFMTQSRAYCGCRARAELGFAPATALDEGMRRAVAWYRAEGLL